MGTSALSILPLGGLQWVHSSPFLPQKLAYPDPNLTIAKSHLSSLCFNLLPISTVLGSKLPLFYKLNLVKDQAEHLPLTCNLPLGLEVTLSTRTHKTQWQSGTLRTSGWCTKSSNMIGTRGKYKTEWVTGRGLVVWQREEGVRVWVVGGWLAREVVTGSRATSTLFIP